jgi:hypothetical protein
MRHRHSERELQAMLDEHWVASATLSTEGNRPARAESRVRMVGLQRAVVADERANTVAYREQGNCFTLQTAWTLLLQLSLGRGKSRAGEALLSL